MYGICIDTQICYLLSLLARCAWQFDTQLASLVFTKIEVCTALVVQLCKLYDLPMGGPAARRLMQRLSGHNAMLGGVQLGLQLALSGLRQLLLIAAPFSGGLSLGPAAPVALAQAALAVHTTRRTGRLTARWLVDQRGRGRRGCPRSRGG